MPAARAARTAPTIASSSMAPENRRSISPSADATPSSRPSPASNSLSSMRLSSKLNSSSRASGLARKIPTSAPGSSPSAAQKALKEAIRLLVITPPQSISRPERGSAAIRHLLRLPRELEHAVAERLQVWVIGAARDRALVVALHEHDRLPQRERHVPAQVAHRAARALLVLLDQLRARGEALAARDRPQRLAQPALGVALLAPHHAQVADVRQRVADRRHLPVEHGGQPCRNSGREDRVAEAVVAVHDRRRARVGQIVRQPSAHSL